LVGNLPFASEDFDETIKLIKKGQYSLPKEDEEFQISPEAKDLLKRMLTIDVNSRISAVDALQHPWLIKAKQGELNKKDMKKTLENLKNFSAGGKLKQALMGFFTTKLMSQ